EDAHDVAALEDRVDEAVVLVDLDPPPQVQDELVDALEVDLDTRPVVARLRELRGDDVGPERDRAEPEQEVVREEQLLRVNGRLPGRDDLAAEVDGLRAVRVEEVVEPTRVEVVAQERRLRRRGRGRGQEETGNSCRPEHGDPPWMEMEARTFSHGKERLSP